MKMAIERGLTLPFVNQAEPGGTSARRSSVGLALIGIYLATGTTYLAVKVVSQELSPVVLTVVRLLGAAVLLMPFTAWRLRRGAAWPTATELRNIAGAGVLLLTVGQVGTAIGISSMPAGIAAVIGSSAPLFLAIFSVIFLRQPLPRQHVFGIVLGFCGIATLTFGSPGGKVNLVGAGAILVASAGWAAGSLYARQVRLPSDPVVALNLQLFFGGLLAVPLSLWPTDRPVDVLQLSGRAATGLGYLIAAAIAAFLAFNWLNQNVSSTVANTFTYVAPVVALAFGVLFLGESVTLLEGLAAGLALAGVVLMVR